MIIEVLINKCDVLKSTKAIFSREKKEIALPEARPQTAKVKKNLMNNSKILILQTMLVKCV